VSREDADKIEVLSSEMRTAQRMLSGLKAKMQALKNEQVTKIEKNKYQKNVFGSSEYNSRVKESEGRNLSPLQLL
jgi:hypothetical protein